MSLDRYHRAQDTNWSGYSTALAEMKAGHKRSHWIWYIFPQLAGLSTSSMSRSFGIEGVGEAEDYLRDSILNPQSKIVMNFAGAMPSFKGQLKTRELMGLIDLIKNLDQFDETGKPKPGTPAAEREAAASK